MDTELSSWRDLTAIMEAIPHETRWSILYTMQIASTEAVNKTPSHPIFLCPSSCAVKPDMPNVVQLSHLCMHNSSQSTSVNQDICTNYCNSCRIPAVSADSKRVKECCTHCPYSLILESCRVLADSPKSHAPPLNHGAFSPRPPQLASGSFVAVGSQHLRPWQDGGLLVSLEKNPASLRCLETVGSHRMGRYLWRTVN